MVEERLSDVERVGKRPGWACRELVFLLSGEEWSGATVEEVARILRAAGYEVGEPVRD